MMDRISICKALAKRREIDPFLKHMVTGDEKFVTYYNIVRKRSWSKCAESAQTVAKSGLTARKDTSTVERNSGLGRPRAKMTREDRNLSIISWHSRDTTASLVEPNFKNVTVSKKLNERGLCVTRPVLCVSLSSENSRVRLKCRRVHRD
ncbi:hypothetical protein TNCV_5006601 [Trichonephila clavipes]|uniref:Transposase n=1 Tax=Trichonephila clavipes TaxID=2585209 RepID=A0A8X6S786_TRICX|nr:hypothetical protein TNCV_5006601 [Trichonephila clavipes]